VQPLLRDGSAAKEYKTNGQKLCRPAVWVWWRLASRGSLLLACRWMIQVETSAALPLCIVGLLGVFAVGYPGYFVFDAVWPSFYYSPVADGKNAWLLGQRQQANIG
jgi:hypothetical protein